LRAARAKAASEGRDYVLPDGSGWADFLLVGDMWNLALVIPLFTVIGLAGLFVAHAWENGAMHTAGIALFIVSGAIIFLDMKHVFDGMESTGQ
jgi:hypothetical protein